MSKTSLPYEGMDWDELSWKIDNEGFDYFFIHYTSPDSFECPMLRDLAREYVHCAKALKDYIKANCTEEGAF